MKVRNKILAIILSICMVVSSVPFFAIAENNSGETEKSSLQFAGMSDIHYYPEEMYDLSSEAWRTFSTLKGKELQQSVGILNTALDSVIAKKDELGTKYLFIAGDLTKDGEYEGHAAIAKVLENFEKRSGIQVLVINGNHDINNSDACSFTTGTKVPSRKTMPEDFKEIYKNLGYDLAYRTYTPAENEYAGGLSYAVKLDDNYTMICVDTGVYEDEHHTDGAISDSLLKWIDDIADEAKSEGRTVMVMQHHSVAPHNWCEPSIMFAFNVADYQRIAENYAEHGIKYTFTGHLHTNDIASVTDDYGRTVYDCEIGSLTGYPNQIRECKITTFTNHESKMDYSLLDCDYAREVVCNGKTYAKPFAPQSFAINFGGNQSKTGYADCTSFFVGVVNGFLGPVLEEIRDGGGVNNYLKTKNIDLRGVLNGYLSKYIGDGVQILGIKLFTVDNIMWFIEDLFTQLEDLYINNPAALSELLTPIIDRVFSFKVSDVPCTKFIDKLHFGDPNKSGTLGDLVLSGMAYWYEGNENSDDDAFVKDAINNFRNGTLGKDLIYELIDIIYNDLVNDAILSKLHVRLDKLVKNSFVTAPLRYGIQTVTRNILKGDTTYKNLLKVFFDTKVLPYSDLYDILDQLLIQEYMTDTQWEQIGEEIAFLLDDFTTDNLPKAQGDNDVTYYTYNTTPEVSTETYRLPTMISQTMGDDTATSGTISWYTKASVTGTDIEIYEADNENDVTFTGAENPTSITVTKSDEQVERPYYGLDFSFIGFFAYNLKFTRHTISLSNLKPGTKYFYRIGDASKNWWSDTGCLETADGSNEVTFLHMSDPQSGTKNQYERAWANVVNSAFKLYPDAKFIVATGDMADYGTNVFQWQWMFDSASDNLTRTFLMPVTGNHEKKKDFTTVDYFKLPNVPEQDLTSGVYYSYTYNNVHVSVLNTNDLNSDKAISEAQIQWLKDDIAKSSNASWHIVALHKAPYSNGSHYDDKDVIAIRNQLSTLMPQLGIDLVLQGHDHVYLRTYSLNGNKVVDSTRNKLLFGGNEYIADVTPSGTTYVISGTSGVKVYNAKPASATDEQFPRAEKAVLSDKSMFSAIQIKDKVLYFDAYKVSENGDTEKVDSFAIQKDKTQGNIVGPADSVVAENHVVRKGLLAFLEKIMDIVGKIIRVLNTLVNAFFAPGVSK